MNLAEFLSGHPPSDSASFRPLRFNPLHEDDQKALSTLLEGNRDVEVVDTLRLQLAELIEDQEPTEDLRAEEIAERVEAHLAGQPLWAYGTWFYYPWRRRLVHVLPKKEFCAVRQSRNRNKITVEEQVRLRNFSVGFLGLSVGQECAVVMAMEGIGGAYRLADFDEISLSNLNRIRQSVDSIGHNKAVLTARTITGINPYARVTLFQDGLTDDNVDDFLLGDGKLDLLVEECDDLYMKVHVRERARAAQIPVLMETSDRGLLDVERFDREPQRPLMHGLLGDIDRQSLRGLDTHDKVPIVFRILGETSITDRLAASLVEVKSTLKSWPQLASCITLASSLTVNAARRIFLGEFNSSGRFYVDVDDLVRDGRAVPVGVTANPQPVAEATSPQVLPSVRGDAPLDHAAVEKLVKYGTMAPSGGNCQPWRFVYRKDGRLRCIHDEERSRSFLDFENRASYMSFGAVVENIALAADQMGHATDVHVFPDPQDPRVVCDLRFSATDRRPRDARLFEQISQRVTNRKLGERKQLPAEIAAALMESPVGHRGRLQLLTDPAALDALGDLLGRGDRIRFLHSVMHREMISELRWNEREVRETLDGLDITTLELTPTDFVGLRLTSSWRVMGIVARMGGGRSLEKPSRKALVAACAAGLLLVDGDAPADYFRGGRGLQRIWLTATAHGLSFQPVTALTYLFPRLAAGGEGLPESDRREMTDLREKYCSLFSLLPGQAEIMLFRFAFADPPTSRALRRPVEDVLAFQ